MLVLLPFLSSCSFQSLWESSPLSLNITAALCTVCFVVLGIRAVVSRLCRPAGQPQAAGHGRDDLLDSALAMQPISPFSLAIEKIGTAGSKPEGIPLDGIPFHLAQMIENMCQGQLRRPAP
jgi:hypothetical protein